MFRLILFVAGFALSSAVWADDTVVVGETGSEASESFVDEALTAELEEKNGPWRFLGCGRVPYECLYRARYYRFPFWLATRQPGWCGYYGWACYGRF